MRAPPEWLVALRDQHVFRVSGFVYPLWWLSNTVAGRFHEAGDPATQYFASHPFGAYAEMLRVAERALGRSIRGGDVAAAQEFTLWTLRLDAGEVFDLTYDSAHVVGLTPADLVDDSQIACRQAGRAMGHGDPEFPTVWRYPSAALPGIHNYVIFGRRVMSQYLQPAVSASNIPGTLVTRTARAPDAVLRDMRHIGDTHPELAAHGSGTPFRWDQPVSFP